MSRISGPLLDRIDLQITVPRLEYADMIGGKDGATSEEIREQVEAARERQRSRFRGSKTSCNAAMSTRALRKTAMLTTEAEQMMQTAFNRLQLSARAYERILKVARTIADLDASDAVMDNHVAEALSYRAYDRQAFLA